MTQGADDVRGDVVVSSPYYAWLYNLVGDYHEVITCNINKDHYGTNI